MLIATIRALLIVATGYAVIVAVLWALQSRFIYPAPQAPAPLIPGYEEVQLQTSDGLQLRSFYRPADPGMPTVLYFHGNGGTLRWASVSNAALAEAGIGILLVEYRGYGGNPGKPSEEGFYRDGVAAARWLTEQGIGSSETVFIGNSIGSGVASHLAVAVEEGLQPPAALILIAPFTSLPDAAADKLWWLPARRLVRDQFDNRAKLDEQALPILIQHGGKDDLIGDHHGRALVEVAPNAEFQFFADDDHCLSFEQRSQEARRDWILAQFARD